MAVRVKVLFSNKGEHSAYGYIRYLTVGEWNGSYYKHMLRTRRDTFLARAIERFIIRKDFLTSGKRRLERTLSVKRFDLLKGMCEAGSKYWQLYDKALRNKWTTKELEAQLFWRLV